MILKKRQEVVFEYIPERCRNFFFKCNNCGSSIIQMKIVIGIEPLTADYKFESIDFDRIFWSMQYGYLIFVCDGCHIRLDSKSDNGCVYLSNSKVNLLE